MIPSNYLSSAAWRVLWLNCKYLWIAPKKTKAYRHIYPHIYIYQAISEFWSCLAWGSVIKSRRLSDLLKGQHSGAVLWTTASLRYNCLFSSQIVYNRGLIPKQSITGEHKSQHRRSCSWFMGQILSWYKSLLPQWCHPSTALFIQSKDLSHTVLILLAFIDSLCRHGFSYI